MWIGLVVEGPSLSCNNIYNFDVLDFYLVLRVMIYDLIMMLPLLFKMNVCMFIIIWKVITRNVFIDV
jgi:hypothetical protein